MAQDKTHYEKQHRGGSAAYESYFAGMDSSMQQKVALTTAHFPVRGRIADMGSGSGRGTFDLASLYHGLELVGVDINPISVERAAEKYQRPNLSYVVGDIAEMVFPSDSLDGILDSSVLHHVTSFNSFDVNRVLTTFDNQVSQLKTGGVIIIRDFVIPDGPEHVYLDLPTSDGKESGTTKELSTAALFELFTQQWRSSVNPHSAVPFTEKTSPRAGFRRFELTLRTAAEFVLRKDYRADWDTEVLEEYTYLTQSQFESAFRTRGLRIVTSRPLWNPWIVQNRFQNKFFLTDLNNSTLPFPPTNYLIVGEKVASGEGVELSEALSAKLTSPSFLHLSAYRHKQTKSVMELVERPHQTVDILPWFETGGQLFVLAKKDFPRPLVNAGTDQPRLSRATHSGYVSEPLSGIVEHIPSIREVVSHILSERAGLSDSDLISIADPFHYFTSPGAVNELVMACLVEIAPQPSFAKAFPNYTSFKGAGSVRELDAQQVLRASHVGGMFDARIEINIYRLFHELKRKTGPWIGAPIKLTQQSVDMTSNVDVLTALESIAFDPCELNAGPGFLSVREGSFVERSNDEKVISEVRFEYVVPQSLSFNSVSAIPVLKTSDGIFVGVESRDLPAVQKFTGSSRIATVPAWRLPREIVHLAEVPEFLNQVMPRDFNLKIRHLWELGGSYFSSPGLSPEVVYPFAAEVESLDADNPNLSFVEIDELKRSSHLIKDAHLLISLYRLSHALQGMSDML